MNEKRGSTRTLDVLNAAALLIVERARGRMSCNLELNMKRERENATTTRKMNMSNVALVCLVASKLLERRKFRKFRKLLVEMELANQIAKKSVGVEP